MKHGSQEHLTGGLRLASFSERVLAFLIDAAPFAAGYILLSEMMMQRGTVSASHAAVMAAMAAALFTLYTAFASSEGRVSLGKMLLGLRVVSTDHEPLTLPQAIMRSATYIVSSAGGLGFVWSLLNPSRQCWHDMVVGSVVVTARKKPLRSLRMLRAGAMASLAILALGFMWTKVWAPRYNNIMLVAYAQVGLTEMAGLQKTYYNMNGEYADSLFALAEAAIDPTEFLEEMLVLFDDDEGIIIEADKEEFTIVARARDLRGTPVRIAGPA